MKCFLVIYMIVGVVFAFVQAEDTCKIENKVVKVGESYSPPGKCIQYKCQGPNSFSALGCAVEQTLKPCKFIPQDNSKPYPKCCSHHEC